MKIGLFIGRFSPVHVGHISTINKMLAENDKVIIAIGSHEAAFSPNKMLSSSETIDIFRATFPCTAPSKNVLHSGLNPNITFILLHDNLYNDLSWATNVRLQVQQTIRNHFCPPPEKFNVTLYGYSKDFTSKYLNWFPYYALKESEPYYINNVMLNATDIRQHIFEIISKDEKSLTGACQTSLENCLLNYMQSGSVQVLLDIIDKNYERFIDLKMENESYKKYKEAWATAPYPPVFVTGDAVVFCNGYVLTIKRKFYPGKSLYALPGGFINQNETVKECIIRELKEETNINIPPGKLNNSVKHIEIFDAPNRSLRGRTITNAGVIILYDETTLPKVRALDDAESVFWMPIELLPSYRSKFFEDHYHIIQNLLKHYQEV